jgi:hypothetical protein
VIVSAASAGTYTNAVTVAGSFGDPNPADNSVSATRGVTAAIVQNPAPTVSLARVPLKEAKRLVTALGCAVGKPTTNVMTLHESIAPPPAGTV